MKKKSWESYWAMMPLGERKARWRNVLMCILEGKLWGKARQGKAP